MPVLTAATFGKFCREIALGLDTVETLLHEWEITDEQWAHIKGSESFAREMATIHREVAEQGPDAGYIFRMKSLSEELIPHIVKMMDDNNVAPSIKVDLIKFCAEIGRLRPTRESAAQGQGGPTGPMVTFNFGPGLPIKTIEVVDAPNQAHIVDRMRLAAEPVRAGGGEPDSPALDGFPG